MRVGSSGVLAGALALAFWVAACGGKAEQQGGLGQPCYGNQTCNAPFVCVNGTCVQTGEEDKGSLGQPCYTDQTCDDPYVCQEGNCVDSDPSPAQTTVRSLRDGTEHVCVWDADVVTADCDTYELRNLVAVSRVYGVAGDNPPLWGFFAEQDPTAADRTYGGILVTFRAAHNPGFDIADIVPGAVVDVIGLAVMRFDNLQISDSVVAVVANMEEPEPVLVLDSETLAVEGTQAVAYQGVLVEVRDVVSATERDLYGAFALTSGLRVDRYFHEAPVEIGMVYDSIIGPTAFTYNQNRILPRSSADVMLAEPKFDGPTVRSLRDGTDYVCTWNAGGRPADCETHQLQGLVAVSAVYIVSSGSSTLMGFFAEQDPTAADRTYGGIFVTFRDTDNPGLSFTDIVPGTMLDATGEAILRFDNLQLSESELTIVGGLSAPSPVLVSDCSTLATGGIDVAAYQGVLVEIRDVVAATERDQFGAFALTCGLWVDRLFHEAPVQVGTVYTSLVGPTVFTYGQNRILPRSSSDVPF